MAQEVDVEDENDYDYSDCELTENRQVFCWRPIAFERMLVWTNNSYETAGHFLDHSNFILSCTIMHVQLLVL